MLKNKSFLVLFCKKERSFLGAAQQALLFEKGSKNFRLIKRV
jgi:hypothetical protein